MKIVKIHAYLNNNVGDDLMVEVLLKRYPSAVFWDCIPNQKKPISFECLNFFNNEDIYSKFGRINHIANILTLYKKKDFLIKFIFRHIEKKSCCSVAVGGAIYRPIAGELIEDRIIRETKKMVKGVPFIVLSANFGPYDDEEFREAFFSYFEKCDLVSFRDSASYELFKSIPHVQWAPDIVFSIAQGHLTSQGDILISIIDFAIRPHLIVYEAEYINKIVEICIACMDRGKNPVLVSFCDGEGDSYMIKKINSQIKKMGHDSAKVYEYKGNTTEIIQLFRNAEFVVATRFHAMVLAMKFKKPLFVISYELKMNNVLSDTGYSAYCQIESISKLDINNVFFEGNKEVVCEDYFEQVYDHFVELDKILDLQIKVK